MFNGIDLGGREGGMGRDGGRGVLGQLLMGSWLLGGAPVSARASRAGTPRFNSG